MSAHILGMFPLSNHPGVDWWCVVLEHPNHGWRAIGVQSSSSGIAPSPADINSVVLQEIEFMKINISLGVSADEIDTVIQEKRHWFISENS